jgi:2-iminoacetate synthase
MKTSTIVDTDYLEHIVAETQNPHPETIIKIIEKAMVKKGLSLLEVGYLVNLKDSEFTGLLLKTASAIKQQIYGERLVFFAPFYVSDYCVNDCEYCNFHMRNKELVRRRQTLDEVEEQTRFLIDQGHKRILLESGEDSIHNTIDYVVQVIEKIYSVSTSKGNIRRINVNIAATTKEDYRKLKQAGIGTYQLFQETYHKPTYEKLHCGPKADYLRQMTAHGRAFEAGIDDVGLGVLFGLYDWRFEVLGLVAHAQYLDKTYGVGPHTISVPRFQPAPSVYYKPEHTVSDQDFLRLIAIVRLAVPYTGMIISTRERPEIRRAAFKIGISQTSAGSVTTTGGYGKEGRQPQFILHDHRPLSEVIVDAVEDKLLPSFCTACYRSRRTGKRFMELAKPGEIHKLCRPNAILTFAEYLFDYTTDGLMDKGKKLIREYLEQIEDEALKRETKKRLEQIAEGKRDVYF